MPDDEQETLLRFKGDASGALRAGKEATQAVEGVQQATTLSARHTQLETKQTAEELGKQHKKTEEGVEGFGDLAKAMGTSERAANAFREAIGRVSPELGAMLTLGIKGADILQFAFSKLGATIVGITAGVSALALAMKHVIEETRRAKAAFEEMQAAGERMRATARSEEQQVVQAAAQAGLPVKALGKARALAGRMTQLGIPREAAVAAAPYLVDEEGRQQVSDEEALKLAVAQERGDIQLAHPYPRGRKVLLKVARRKIEAPGLKEAIENATEQLLAARFREAEETSRLGPTGDIEALVERWTGETGERLQEHVATIRRQLREGPRMGYKVGRDKAIVGEPNWLQRQFGLDRPEPVEELDPLVPHIRTRVRQARETLEAVQSFQRTRGQAEVPSGASEKPAKVQPEQSTRPALQTKASAVSERLSDDDFANRSLEQRLSDWGFRPGVGKSLAPYLTDQRGRMQVTDEEAIRIAAAYEGGHVSRLPGGTPMELEAHRFRMLREIEGRGLRDAVDRAAAPHLQTYYVEQAIQAGMKIARDKGGASRTVAGSAQPEPAMTPAPQQARQSGQGGPRQEKVPQPQPPIVIQNHGTMHFAPDDRFAKVRRMTAAG